MSRPEERTTDFALEDLKQRSFFAPEGPAYSVRVGAQTHQGKVRKRNEDHYAVFCRTRSCEMLMTNLDAATVQLRQDKAYGMVVADGMGGSAFGDFASQLALQVMFEMAHRATSWLMKFDNRQTDDVQARVDAYVRQIQRVFHEQGKQDPRMKSMGTTWTSAHLFAPHAILVHIGDSRAYLWRDEKLTQITRDQTLAQDLLDAGAPPEHVKAFRHVLTNSLSAEASEVKSDVIHLKLKSGDRLMLCTDGLSDMVDDDTIAKLITDTDPQTGCDRFVEKALENGGRDNITVVMADIEQIAAE